jgi:serine/threonine protein kinase
MPSAQQFIPDLTRRIIGDRFQLLEKLGSGSYGVVYRAVDLDCVDSPTGQTSYAVKCMLQPDVSERRKVFNVREIEIQLQVHSHPNVLTIHEVHEDEDLVYIVCDFMSGGDLYDHVFATKSQFYGNDELVRSVFLQVLEAVEFCHDNSIYHRDIKADNILCSADLRHVVVADFGLATTRSSSSQFGCGTSYYQSPGELDYLPSNDSLSNQLKECLREDCGDLDSYSTRYGDIWSLGIVFINMITGRTPWGKAAMSDPCFEAYVSDRRWLCMHLPLSPEAERLAFRMLELNPRLRISLEDLKDEIKHARTFFATKPPLAERYAAESKSASSSLIVEGIRNSVVRRALATRSRARTWSDSDVEPESSAELRLWEIIDARINALHRTGRAGCDNQDWSASDSPEEFRMRAEDVRRAFRKISPPQCRPCSSTDCSIEGCRQAKRQMSSAWYSSSASFNADSLSRVEKSCSVTDEDATAGHSSSQTDESDSIATPEALPVKPAVDVPEAFTDGVEEKGKGQAGEIEDDQGQPALVVV